jgi:predicted nucleic acid-binding Zn ribbon protein
VAKDAGPQRLRDLLAAYGKSVGLDQALQVGRLWQRWGQVVGPQIAAHAEPTSLKDGVLRIRTDSPTWATEIGYLSEQIKQRVNELSQSTLVTEVKVWTGPPRPEAERAARPAPRTDDGPGETPEGSLRPSDQDPIEALRRARSAWAEKRRQRPR